MDAPTADCPAEIDCPFCEGSGCQHCSEGVFELTVCPQTYIDAELVDVIHLAALTEKGLPPVAGGSLDQAAWFAAACNVIWAEQANWKRSIGNF